MASPTQYYVDPNAGVDTTGGGAGGISAPWKSTQYALNHITRDVTNGDQVNVKAGTADVLTATLSLTTYGTPAAKQPLIFRGYTSAAGDGGFGDIDGGALNVSILATTAAGVYFADMKLHNTGSAFVVAFSTGGKCGLYRCELYDSTGGGIASTSLNSVLHVRRCYLHDITGCGVATSSSLQTSNVDVRHCYFKNGSTRKFTDTLFLGGFCSAYFNVFNLTGTSSGIHFNRDSIEVVLNSIYGGGSSGKGIYCDDGTNDHNAVVENNYVEGFSGVGGKGISLVSGSKMFTYGGNYFYNNATHETLSGDIFINLGTGNTILASAFANPAGEDFTIGTALKALGLPASFLGGSTAQSLDVGAAQRAEAAGGGGSIAIDVSCPVLFSPYRASGY